MRSMRLGDVSHLVRRFVGSLSRREPSVLDTSWAVAHLDPGERRLWESMSVQDRRHSIEVARRFVALMPDAARAEIAGVLLHDVGKVAARLGTLMRVVATVVGPRTSRFRAYHDHERAGAEMVARAGGAELTVRLVRRDPSLSPDLLAALARADHV